MKTYFLVDPTAVTSYGHNIDGLDRIATQIRKYGHNVVCIVPENCPSEFTQIFHDYEVHPILPKDYAIQHEPPHWGKLIPERFRRYLKAFLILVWFVKGLYSLRKSIKKFESIFKFQTSDQIIFVNADNLGTTAFLLFLKKFKGSWIIRLINVYEHLGIPKFWNFRKFAKLIGKKINYGYKIDICAETENYAEWLGEYFNEIEVVPYPVTLKPPFQGNFEKPINIGVLGSARWDKGFEDLPKIIESFDGNPNYRFTIQLSSQSWGGGYFATTCHLHGLFSTTLLKGYLSREELNYYFEETDVMLLPYIASTYITRGSAMFVESIENGIPVVAPAITAIGREIKIHNLGATYSETDEIKREIDNCVGYGNSQDFEEARTKYENYCKLKWEKVAKL